MNKGLNNKNPTVIKRDFTGQSEEDNDERHILELRGSVNNTGLTDASEEHMGLLFSAQQNQTTTHGNSAGSIMVESIVDSDGVITGSDLVLNIKNNGSTVNSSLSEGLRIKKEGGLTIPGDLTVGGTVISLGDSTSETTINDNLTITGDLTVSGTTSYIYKNRNYR